MKTEELTEDLKMGLREAGEFEMTLRRAGFLNPDIDKATKNVDLCRQWLALAREQAEITAVQHLIDCDANPFVPKGWSVEAHVKGGKRAWDASKVSLHLDKGQKGGKYVEGHKLRKALKGQPVLNANVLDYLLANPHLIPEDWKGKAVFFWGTIYRNSDGILYVRFLYWHGGRWDWGYDWLDNDWGASSPAAVVAS